MWAEACQMLEQAERLHQQFFGRAAVGRRIAWQPPADVFEDEHQVLVVVALPGVPPECINVVIDGNSLTISADCEMPIPGASCAIRRMEIPHGYFERRIDLPAVRLSLGAPQSKYGCVILTLRKLDER
jgi:HSP20 family molecular chaperone IbpA